ncbi:unnamed protein product [Closterium sp. Naga37s-1]|nr:unnamed protein product [Closterium sp. Naga37s-1]
MPTWALYTALRLLVLSNLFQFGLSASRQNESSLASVVVANEIVAGRVDEMESELEEALAGRTQGDVAAGNLSSIAPLDNQLTSLTGGDKHRSPPLSVSVARQSLSSASPAAANASLDSAITLKEREAEERAKVAAKRCYGMQRAYRMGFERGGMAWEPQADRYVLMDCHRNQVGVVTMCGKQVGVVTRWGVVTEYGNQVGVGTRWGVVVIRDIGSPQLSNRIRCIKNHLVVAGVFNRTLVVPLRAHEVARHYDRRTFFHLPSATVQVDQVLCLQKQCYNQSAASRDDLPSLSGVTYPPNLALTIGNASEPLEIPKLLALRSLIQPTARVVLLGDLGSMHLTFPGKNYLDVPFRQSIECPNALAVAPHPAILEAAREFVRSVVLPGSRREWEAADADVVTEGGKATDQPQQQQKEGDGNGGGKGLEGGRAVGRYMGVHWRRTDLMQHSNPNARLSVEHAGACLVKAMGMAGNISTMFLASDTDDREVEALEKFMKERILGFKLVQRPNCCRASAESGARGSLCRHSLRGSSSGGALFISSPAVPPPPITALPSPAAVVRLLRVEQGGAYADILSGAAAGEGAGGWELEMQYVRRTLGFGLLPLEGRGRRHVTELVAGVTRWRRYLDFLLSEFFSGSLNELERMEPLLKQILRLGMFELAKMDTPPHAAVNEAVKLARAALRPGAASLANAILRAAVRAQEQGPLPAPSLHDAMTDRDKARALATLHSHPVWMVRRWADRLGWREAERLMESNNARPVFSLRANTAKGVSRSDLHSLLLALPEVEVEDSPYLDDFIRVKAGMQHVLTAGLIEDGSCNVQDESAGLVVKVLAPQPGETVVDCCAAPGGKAMYAAGLMQGTGRLVAVDVNEGRVRMVAQAAQRQGLQSMVECVSSDLRTYAASSPLRETADRVLLDAPCSGLGVLAKRADLRWRRTVEGEAQLTALQDDLLDAAASLVRPGGLLVYSTCSIEPSENEDRITTFLQTHHEFVLEPLDASVLPEAMISRLRCFASLPHCHAIDGAFAARLRRREL